MSATNTIAFILAFGKEIGASKDSPNTMILSNRFPEALLYATQLHALQVRKGSGVPYIAHLLGVSSLVLEYGGNEDQAIAALLHDAIGAIR